MQYEDRLIDRNERCVIAGASDATLTRLEKRGEFPKRIKLSPRRVAWRLSDVREWLEAKAKESA